MSLMSIRRLTMRELTVDEIEEVEGGFGVWGAAIGAAVGLCTAVTSGANFGEGAVLVTAGAASGFFGGIAGQTGSRALNAVYASKAVAIGGAGVGAAEAISSD